MARQPIQTFTTKRQFQINPFSLSSQLVTADDYCYETCGKTEKPFPPILDIKVYSNPPNKLCYRVDLIYKDKFIIASFDPFLNPGNIGMTSRNGNERIIVLIKDNNQLYPEGELALQPYVAEDLYMINFGFNNGLPEFYVIFERFSSNPIKFANSTGNFTQTSNLIAVPQITITGQTLVDDSDIGNMIFEIIDRLTYYDHKAPKSDGTCQLDHIIVDQTKLTLFEQCCPKIVSVIKGTANTLRSRLYDLYINWDLRDTIYFEPLYTNFIQYSMVRYLLGRVLYLEFNIKILLQRYNQQFFSDLKDSRFCNFINYFTQTQFQGYDDFYRY